MGRLKGRFMRMTCDNPCHPKHKDGTSDFVGKTLGECEKIVHSAGWRKTKGDWYCPECAKYYKLK